MLKYRAEGLCRNANHLSREELSRCMASGEVLQSTALAYDTGHRLRFELGGLRGIMPTECGCPSMVRLYQELGRWVENDAYVPSLGDVIFYDWQDSGVGDNAGQPDHVGIVAACDGQTMTIIEGNCDNAVKTRALAVNARFIRGYGIPDFASKADGAEPQPAPEPAPEPTPEPEPEKPAVETTVDPFITAKAREVIAGKWGNGQARKDALAAWFTKAVQDEVNRILGG